LPARWIRLHLGKRRATSGRPYSKYLGKNKSTLHLQGALFSGRCGHRPLLQIHTVGRRFRPRETGEGTGVPAFSLRGGFTKQQRIHSVGDDDHIVPFSIPHLLRRAIRESPLRNVLVYVVGSDSISARALGVPALSLRGGLTRQLQIHTVGAGIARPQKTKGPSGVPVPNCPLSIVH